MKYRPEYPCYIQYDCLWVANSHTSLSSPAVLINSNEDNEMLFKWGEYNHLIPYLDKFTNSCAKIGENPENVLLIDLSNLSAEEQCYIINSMVTSSGFVKTFCEHFSEPTNDWLKAEMTRHPYYIVKRT